MSSLQIYLLRVFLTPRFKVRRPFRERFLLERWLFLAPPLPPNFAGLFS
jgi:hypothetical protein